MSSNKQVIVITGGNQGIGWEAAKAIVTKSADYHVIICSRAVERGQKAVSDLTSLGIKGSLSLVQLDVTNDESIAKAVQQIGQDYGRVDALVNNAGIEMKEGTLYEKLSKILTTNAIAPAIVTEAFLDLLKKSKNARIIYVTSGLGSITLKTDMNHWYSTIPNIPYRMSKSALNMLAAAQSVDLKNDAVKVFCFDPGYTVTNLTGEGDRKNRSDMGAWEADVPGKAISQIVEGGRDADVGKFIHPEGTHPW